MSLVDFAALFGLSNRSSMINILCLDCAEPETALQRRDLDEAVKNGLAHLLQSLIIDYDYQGDYERPDRPKGRVLDGTVLVV